AQPERGVRPAGAFYADDPVPPSRIAACLRDRGNADVSGTDGALAVGVRRQRILHRLGRARFADRRGPFRPGSRGEAPPFAVSLPAQPRDRRPQIRRRQVLVLSAGRLSKARILVSHAGGPVGDRRGRAALLLAGDASDLAGPALAEGCRAFWSGRPL